MEIGPGFAKHNGTYEVFFPGEGDAVLRFLEDYTSNHLSEVLIGLVVFYEKVDA